MERSPWTFNAILTVAAKVRSGNGPLSPTYYKCLEDTQAVARSSLFGSVLRKEAVQGIRSFIVVGNVTDDTYSLRDAPTCGLEL